MAYSIFSYDITWAGLDMAASYSNRLHMWLIIL
jgi:hypothetical protein